MSNIKFIDEKHKIKWTSFSDGSESCLVMLDPKAEYHPSRIICRIEDCNRDIIRIGLVKDALERMDYKDIDLTIDYMPQARADRVFQDGASLPIKVFCVILNSYKFKSVLIADPHSDVTPALIDNVRIYSQAQVFNNNKSIVQKYVSDFTLVAPDLGATKKTFELAHRLGHNEFYQAIKVRNVETGDIVKCDLVDKIVTGNVVIVDDIADGGASFLHLAKLLKERGADQVALFVTHGIFSKGLQIFEGIIDFIFVHDIVGNYINQEDVRKFNVK